MAEDDLFGALAQRRGLGRVLEAAADETGQVGRFREPDCCPGLEQSRGDLGEVLGIGAEAGGGAITGRFEHVLATPRPEAPADERDLAEPPPVAEFADGIDEDDGFGGPVFGRGMALAPPPDDVAAGGDQFGDLIEPFFVSGDDDQPQLAMAGRQFAVGVECGGFFARLGAAGEQDLVPTFGRRPAGEAMDFGGVAGVRGVVEFDRSGHGDRFGSGAAFDEALGGLCVLATDPIEPSEGRCEESPELRVAPAAASAEPAVGDRHAATRSVRQPDEVRPDFEFGQDEEFGPEGVERLFDGPAEIERGEKDGVIWEAGPRQVVAGVGGGADDDPVAGVGIAEGGDEPGDQVHLADADGVEPRDRFRRQVRQGGAEVIRPQAETFLADPSAITAEPRRAINHQRRDRDQQDGVQEV